MLALGQMLLAGVFFQQASGIIGKQLGESVVNNLKERQLFSDQMNRNRFDLILARRYYNCSPIENLRCLILLQMKKFYETVWSSNKTSFKQSINPVVNT